MAKQETSQNTRTSERPAPSPAPRTERKTVAPRSTPQVASSVLTLSISHEEIAARAYAHFLARGSQPGDDWADWFRAEAELGREKAIKAVEILGNG